ncbi:MAG: ribosome-associated translation inhibitor RaiA [Bacteroidota bacterium]
MNITFEYDGVSASERLEELIIKKLNKMESKFDFIIQAHIFLRTQNTSSPMNGKICKIQLSVPGPQLFAESNSKSFERSIREATGDVERQLSKKKEKMKAH